MTSRRSARVLVRPSLEVLDSRIVPTGGGGASTAAEALVSSKGGTVLGAIYQEFLNYDAAGGQGAFTPQEAGRVNFSGTNGTSVGVDIHFNGGDFNTLLGQLKGIGMQVTATAPQQEIVEGYLPISQLPIVAGNAYESSLAPIYKPVPFGPPSTTPTAPVAPTVSTVSTVTTNETLVSSKGGQALGSIFGEYAAYHQAGSVGTFSPVEAGRIFVSGTSVGVDIQFNSNFNAQVSLLQSLGFVVTASQPQNQFVEGYLPISLLPAVAADGAVSSFSPIYRPVAF